MSALSTNTIGAGNTANGVGVLFGNTTGSNNTASGGDAHSNNTTGNLNTAAGFQALNSNDSGLENTAIGATSSARYKQDIETLANRSEGLLKLRPVTFSYKDDTAAAPHYGLIAEEVATVYPELVTRTASGEVQAV